VSDVPTGYRRCFYCGYLSFDGSTHYASCPQLDTEVADLRAKLERAEKALEIAKTRFERLTKVGPPDYAVSGEDVTQHFLEQNCRIAEMALKEIEAVRGGK
jgi:hypothetical protein